MPGLGRPRRPAPGGRAARRSTLAVAGAVLAAAGGSILGLAAASQAHAPQPGPAQAGALAPAWGDAGGSSGRAAATACFSRQCGAVPALAGKSAPGSAAGRALSPVRSLPVLISIPAIGVRSRLLYVGLNRDHTIQVPPLNHPPLTNEAAWYKYSPPPGQVGPSIIEGHVDSAAGGPSVFFRLGALRPGDRVNVTLADHQVAVFAVTGVRLYRKDRFPTRAVFGNTGYAALRLITCGGTFDAASRSYRSSLVAFAALVSFRPA